MVFVLQKSGGVGVKFCKFEKVYDNQIYFVGICLKAEILYIKINLKCLEYMHPTMYTLTKTYGKWDKS